MLSSIEIINALEDWNIWSQSPDIFAGIKRELTNEIVPFLNLREIIVLKGVRRSGKSTMMYQLMQKLIDLGANQEQMLYVNFEEPKFVNDLSIELLNRVYNAFKEKYNPDQKSFIFLDEIQNVPQWERWVRAVYDKRENIKIFVAGSSSKLMSKEFATVLTGRHVAFEVWPLSFSEFLKFNGVENRSEKHKIKNLLNVYMQTGGFPETVNKPKIVQNKLLESYFENIIYKDITERYNVRDVNSLKRLGVLLMTNTSNLLSYNKLSKQLGISLETISNYISYFTEAYLLFENPFFSFSASKQITKPRKIYSIDTGMRNAVAFKFSKDYGRMAENLVALQLRKKGEIFYWRNKYEIDFIANAKQPTPINVCFNDDIPKREIEGLKHFMEEFNVNEGLLITKNTEKEIESNKKKVRLTPLDKWLLED